ncbi:MAG: hypothetical protein EBX37_16540, partial [Alphaproteobacteria bacterium]|nr:hypothetical protein [Alphaproteobacteria bacterium]
MMQVPLVPFRLPTCKGVKPVQVVLLPNTTQVRPSPASASGMPMMRSPMESPLMSPQDSDVAALSLLV